MRHRIAVLSLVPSLLLTRLPSMEEAGRMGNFSTVFQDHHPESTLESVCRRTGYKMEPWDPPAYSYVLQNETWDIYVPPNYRPDRAYGLLVWISSGRKRNHPSKLDADPGQTPDDLDRSEPFRQFELDLWTTDSSAMDAVYNMTKLYTIDPDRITVSGFSGGGRTASIAALNYPDLFPRGLFIAGVNYWEELPSQTVEAKIWMASMPEPNDRSLDIVKDKSRLVLLTGDNDVNRDQTRTYYQTWYRKNTNRVMYLQVPGMKHELPPAEWLDKALSFLDQKPS